MTEQEIIKALQENLAQYGNLPHAYRMKMDEIGDENFEYLDGAGAWVPVTKDTGFDERDRYRLRPDYKQEPEVVKYKLEDLHGNGELIYMLKGTPMLLIHAISRVDFIGFLYEDGTISTCSRIYARKGNTCPWVYVSESDLSNCEVLTPTHVLFKKGK